MSHDFESLFHQEINQRKSEKKEQRVIAVVLFFLVVGSIYCAYHTLFFPLALFMGIQLWLIMRLRSFQRLLSQTIDRVPFFQRIRNSPVGQLNQRSIIGIAVLVSVLILQANPTLITIPFHGMVSRVIHNPQPHTAPSPWPWKSDETMHPAIVKMPPEAEKNIASVAAYIKQAEADPWLRTKAIHDYVIHRLSYDIDVIQNAGFIGSRPKQDAQSVFQAQKAVCEGYAKLFKALGTEMGMEVTYLKGHVRRNFAPSGVIPPLLRFANDGDDWTYHAWNGVKINGNWFLVDPTWDDTKGDRTYRSEYLLLPPEVMIVSHRPEQTIWQLLENPTNVSDFEAQPILSPSFFRDNLELQTPQTYQTKVQGIGEVQIKAPKNYNRQIFAGFIEEKEQGFSFLDLFQSAQDDPEIEWCETDNVNGEAIKLACHFPDPGQYQVLLFTENSEIQESVGQLKFTYTS